MQLLPSIKNHKWAIALAILTSLIVAYPQIYLRYDHADIYSGIDLIGASDDESPWMSRVREVQDGYLSMSNPYFKDAKDDPYLIQPLGSAVIANTGKFIGLGINDTILFSRLFFTFILFLIVYGFILLATKEKLLSLSATAALLLGQSLFGRGAILKLLAGSSPSTTFLTLMRPVNPTMTWIFLFGFLLFFWLFFERKQRRWGVLSAIFLGLSFYDYFYTWTFLYAFCAALIGILILQKKWQDIKNIAAILLASLLAAIPFFINLYRGMLWPTSQEVGDRIGLMDGRMPVITLLPALFFAAVLIFFPRQRKKRFVFFLALAAAPLIVLNQQIITGKALMISHYHWYMHVPLAIVVLAMVFFLRFPQKWQMFKKSLAVLVIVASVFAGIFIQQSSYAAQQKRIVDNQKYGPLMDWFNENAAPEQVALSNGLTAKAIAIYTPLNVFYHPTSLFLFGGSESRLMDSLFLYYRLRGIGKEEARDVFFKERGAISVFLYGIYYRETLGSYDKIPDDAMGKVLRKYEETFSLSTAEYLRHMIAKYEVDFLVWDKKADPAWNLDQYEFLNKLATVGQFEIYGD